MEQFIYTVLPVRSEMLSEGLTEKEEGTLKAHFEYLSGLKDAGTVKLAGRTTQEDANTFGVVILLAEDEEAARRIMANDPAVKDGVMAAKIYPFRIALMGDPI